MDLLKDVELEGVNIPGVIDKTIDFLLERHSCLCGHPILEDSSERDVLIRLKAMVPPAVIGTIAGNLQLHFVPSFHPLFPFSFPVFQFLFGNTQYGKNSPEFCLYSKYFRIGK